SAESLLSQAITSLNSGNHERVFELVDQAQKIIFGIKNAYNFTHEVSVLVDSEASKGFDVSSAESLLSQAESSLVNSGDYERTLDLANQARTLAPDIDRDGLPNKKDFAPSINNNYLYAGAGVSLIALILCIFVFFLKFSRSTQGLKNLKIEMEKMKESEMVLAEEVKVSFSEEDLFSSESGFKKLLSDYEVLELLGEGGFAKVFRVKRKQDGKIIALKLPRIDKNTSSYFMKEVATWYTLNHPNVVKLYRADYSPVPHMEMECINGVQNEGKLIRDLEKYPKPLPEDEAVRIIKGIGEGLRYVHEKGIYHRDLKPLNILLQGDKSQIIPKITDFGLARVEVKNSITQRNAYSPLYAAPEQLDRDKYGDPDQRTDIYHLGVIFYNLLSGDLPYNGASPAAVLAKIISEDIYPDPISKLHPDLSHYDGIFEKLLAKEKENRYSQVNEFLGVMDSLLEVKKERQDLRKSLEITRNTIKISAEIGEIKRLKIEVVEKTVKVLILCIKTNDKAGLISSLGDLADYTEKYKEDIICVVSQLEYMLKEGVSVGADFEEGLRVLLHKIESESKG
ncbi:MAG: serine/threonine-protein kinase, partial [Methanosarcinaceae archaeon]|nr:serine/threonine-protein kinase [Methanosarcinaceae archaeon]